MVGQQGKVPGDAVVELLFAEGGLEVDLRVILVLFMSPRWLDALRVSGPLMPKWVNSISPCSSKMALSSSNRVRVTFFSARPIIFLQSGSRLTRLTRLGTGSTRVCPA